MPAMPYCLQRKQRPGGYVSVPQGKGVPVTHKNRPSIGMNTKKLCFLGGPD